MVVITAAGIGAGAAVVSAGVNTFNAIRQLATKDKSGYPCYIDIKDCPKFYFRFDLSEEEKSKFGIESGVLCCAVKPNQPDKPELDGGNDPILCFYRNDAEIRVNQGVRIVFYNGYFICESNAFKASTKTHAIGRAGGDGYMFAAWDANMKSKYKWQIDFSDPKRIRFYYWEKQTKKYIYSMLGGIAYYTEDKEKAAYAVQDGGDWESLYKDLPIFSKKRKREDE